MDGGRHFLIQHVDLEHDGERIKGIEVIGHLRPFGEAPDEEIRSRLYDNHNNTLDHVSELDGDTLTVCAGEGSRSDRPAVDAPMPSPRS